MSPTPGDDLVISQAFDVAPAPICCWDEKTPSSFLTTCAKGFATLWQFLVATR